MFLTSGTRFGVCAQVLGDHIDQKGSIVLPDRLRFDFTHNGVIDGPSLGKIEAISRQQLQAKMKVYAKEVPLKEAQHINGMPVSMRTNAENAALLTQINARQSA